MIRSGRPVLSQYILYYAGVEVQVLSNSHLRFRFTWCIVEYPCDPLFAVRSI